MATYYSDVYLGAAPRADNSQNAVVSIVGKLTLPSDVAAATGDVLKFVRLPAQAYITKFRIFNSDWGSGDVPCKIGTATDDDDCVATAYALHTSALTTGKTFRNDEDLSQASVSSTNTAGFATDAVVTTAAQDFQATIGTVTATPTAGAYLTFHIEYIHLAAPTAGTVAYTWNGLAAGL